MEKEYRTQEQFEEIADSIYNGQLEMAAKECVEYGFWVKDLIEANEELEIISIENIAYLGESAMQRRQQNEHATLD